MKTQKFVVVVVAIVVCAFGLTVRQDSAHVPNSGSDGSPGAQSVSARSGSSSAPERYVIEGADVYRAFATCFVAFRDSGDRGSGELSGMARIRDAAYDGTELTVAFGTEQTDEWAEGRRYLGLDILAKSRLTLAPDTTPEVTTDPTLELTA